MQLYKNIIYVCWLLNSVICFLLWFLSVHPCCLLIKIIFALLQFSRVQLFATPWTSACQASLSIANSWSLPKLMSIESVMSSNHLVLCRPLLLLPSIFPIIRVFSNESAFCIRWPKYWSSALLSLVIFIYLLFLLN